ncbi:MAG TPA: hypothetical protein V6D22_21705 [Candidatus Obscuribacterales bacterium]
MTKEFKFAVLPAVVSLVYRWYIAADFFSGVGCALCVLAFGLYLVMTDNPGQPLVVDNPLPQTLSMDLATAMETIKTALLNTNFEGYKWRFLQFDPELGSIIACLDVLDLELPADRPPAAVKRQVLLFAEFDDVEGKTRARLQWRVRFGSKRHLATEAIQSATKHIRKRLISVV